MTQKLEQGIKSMGFGKGILASLSFRANADCRCRPVNVPSDSEIRNVDVVRISLNGRGIS